MNINTAESTPSRQPGSDSLDCVDLILEGPGDTKVRPSPPERLPQLMAEREKVARWLKLQEQEKANEKPAEGKDEQNGTM